MTAPAVRILVVEDVDGKYLDLIDVIKQSLAPAEVVRASNLNDAEDILMSNAWGLLVLDLSMDISASGSMDLGSGHATLAGIDVVERISLLKIDVPVVIVTGFDSFQDPDRFDNDIMYIEDVKKLIDGLIGKRNLGIVRYGREHWKVDLSQILAAWGSL